MDAIEKLENFYQRCNDGSGQITHESTLRNLSDRIDRLAIREALDAGLTDEALGVLRRLGFTFEEIGELFGKKAAALRQRARRLKVAADTPCSLARRSAVFKWGSI